MDASSLRSVEAGLAEFTALLVGQTLEAVISALVDQERKIGELDEALALAPPEFADRFLPAAALRTEVLRLFPDPEGRDARSAVDPGASYAPPRDGSPEAPPVLERTGYRVDKGDVEKGEAGRVVFTAAGYARIEAAVRDAAAARLQDALGAVRARGVPRVHVDHGRIAAKMTLRLEAGTGAPATRAAGFALAPPLAARVVVKPVNARSPEFLTLRADVTSEVEITFKTVVE